MATKILSVDDSKMVHMVVKKALKGHEVEVITANDGEEGWKAAIEHKPDLILMDVNMPNMSGPDALAKMKTFPELQATPVIMLTAEATSEVREDAFEKGVHQYLTKPFEAELLIETLNAIVPLQPKA